MIYKKSKRWKTPDEEYKYRSWRKNVFELNKATLGLSKFYVCLKCNKKRKTTRILHAHHISSWHKFPTKRYDIDNGVVLCKQCHKKFHKKYGHDAIEDPTLLKEFFSTEK